MTQKIPVLFVCLGNICRSPLAQGIFEHMVADRGLSDRFIIDSCGTAAWHAGKGPHSGSIAIARKYGISIEHQRARQFTSEDCRTFKWILAMDRQNLEEIKTRGEAGSAHIHLLREFDRPAGELDVPDPYYTGNFQLVYEIIDRSCERLLDKITRSHNLAAAPEGAM